MGGSAPRVEEAIGIPQKVATELFKVRPHVKRARHALTPRLLGHPEVTTFELSDEMLDA